MCIPPFDEDSTQHFKLLKEIADRNNIKNLSMGMSGDFEKAIKKRCNTRSCGYSNFWNKTRLLIVLLVIIKISKILLIYAY